MIVESNLNFIEEIVNNDLKNNKYSQIVTRFPPEPNGYLHIGHAASICLNFGLSQDFGGYTNLRFDDTNPSTEETEYVNSIKEDVKWLGFQWKNEYYASDYFEQLYEFATQLITKDLAYVDDSTSNEIALQKGTPTLPGIPNEYRNRSVNENIKLFEQMKAGVFEDGSKTLRAKINMAHANMLMRDPVLYRIKHAKHHRTGNDWCIYPMYDFAHGQCDSIEKITHSICTLEFAPHRELYDWFIHNLNIFPSHQYEFARRNLTYTVMSKRKLLQLVNDKIVSGWDDPRMPTISGMRRRGYTAKAIKEFCSRAGIAKRDNVVDVGLLEYCVREDLNKTSLRRMVVLNPLKILITNFTKNYEILEAENNPENENEGKRKITFTNEIYIDQEDFLETPPKKYFRLSPGSYVRLKHAYIIQCQEVIKDEFGNITLLKCIYLENSQSGNDTSGIKVKGTLHWVNVSDAINIQVNLYNPLFMVENPANNEEDFKTLINPNSLTIIKQAKAEPSLALANKTEAYQFLRIGYFVLDKNATENNLIFNRSVTLKDGYKPSTI